LGTGFGGYSIYDSTFAPPSISLAAGTYYLSLSGMTAEDHNIYWDETDGASSAYELNHGAIGSELFRLYSGHAPFQLPAFQRNGGCGDSQVRGDG
jgi:hypothetical protein